MVKDGAESPLLAQEHRAGIWGRRALRWKRRTGIRIKSCTNRGRQQKCTCLTVHTVQPPSARCGPQKNTGRNFQERDCCRTSSFLLLSPAVSLRTVPVVLSLALRLIRWNWTGRWKCHRKSNWSLPRPFSISYSSYRQRLAPGSNRNVPISNLKNVPAFRLR
jgi:hypothetical protein